MKKVEIAPSILNADFKNLESEIKKVENLGVRFLHFDVMDGHFVPNISFGAPILASISKIHNMINDVHLMISDPLKYVPDFVKAGADLITFHYESYEEKEKILETIKLIKSSNIKCGISIKPATTVEEILPYLDKVDLVLVMSVEPGFGGQKFNPVALEKIKELNRLKDKNNYHYLIEVDGGINAETAISCRSAGVDVLVCGTYLYRSKSLKEDYEKLIK